MSSPTDGPAPVPSPDPTPSCFSNSGKVQAGVNNSELWSGADLEELDHYEVSRACECSRESRRTGSDWGQAHARAVA